jgi:hypothetical protein
VLALKFRLVKQTQIRVVNVNNLRVVLEPDVSRSDKLNTAMSWDDTAFLSNLRIRRTGLSKKRKGEKLKIITVPMQLLSWICVTSTSFMVVFVATVKKLNGPESDHRIVHTKQ